MLLVFSSKDNSLLIKYSSLLFKLLSWKSFFLSTCISSSFSSLSSRFRLFNSNSLLIFVSGLFSEFFIFSKILFSFSASLFSLFNLFNLVNSFKATLLILSVFFSNINSSLRNILFPSCLIFSWLFPFDSLLIFDKNSFCVLLKLISGLFKFSNNDFFFIIIFSFISSLFSFVFLSIGDSSCLITSCILSFCSIFCNVLLIGISLFERFSFFVFIFWSLFLMFKLSLFRIMFSDIWFVFSVLLLKGKTIWVFSSNFFSKVLSLISSFFSISFLFSIKPNSNLVSWIPSFPIISCGFKRLLIISGSFSLSFKIILFFSLFFSKLIFCDKVSVIFFDSVFPFSINPFSSLFSFSLLIIWLVSLLSSPDFFGLSFFSSLVSILIISLFSSLDLFSVLSKLVPHLLSLSIKDLFLVIFSLLLSIVKTEFWILIELLLFSSLLFFIFSWELLLPKVIFE